MNSQLNIVDASDLAGLRLEACCRVGHGRRAEHAGGDGGPLDFLALLLQGIRDETQPSTPSRRPSTPSRRPSTPSRRPSTPSRRDEGSGSNHIPSDVNEQPAREQAVADPIVPNEEPGDRTHSSAPEQTPSEQMSLDRDTSVSEVTARESVGEPERAERAENGDAVLGEDKKPRPVGDREKAEELEDHGAFPSENRGRDAVGEQEDAEGPEGSAPSPKLRPAPAPECGEPAEPQVRTPQQTATPENVEATESNVTPSQETAVAADKVPEAFETAGLTRASEIVVELPAGEPLSTTEEPVPDETNAGNEPKQPVEQMAAPADARPLVLDAAAGKHGSGSAPEAKPDAPDPAPEEPDETTAPAPHAPREPRPNSGHLPETSREASHEPLNAADREVPIAAGEAETTPLNALGARQPATVPTMAPGADAVTSVASSLGAEIAGESPQGEGQQNGLDASVRNTNGLQADSAPDADVVDRLDSVFKQVLSTARLPVDLRQRIELARSIGRQVVRNAVASVRNGQTHVLLQLRPPSLGTVRMHLTTENQAVSARLMVENNVVRQAVEQHVEQLRAVLREEGFSLNRFEVSVRTQAEADPWASAHAGGNDQHAGGAGGREDGDAADEARDEQSLGHSAVWASTHDGIVDYVA